MTRGTLVNTTNVKVVNPTLSLTQVQTTTRDAYIQWQSNTACCSHLSSTLYQYLLGQKFTVRKDHGALPGSSNQGQLAHWPEKLQEFQIPLYITWVEGTWMQMSYLPTMWERFSFMQHTGRDAYIQLSTVDYMWHTIDWWMSWQLLQAKEPDTQPPVTLQRANK